MSASTEIEVPAEHPVTITHPDKLLWPEAGITKLGYVRYLAQVAPVMLPHLQDRLLTMIRFPDGIHGHSFYQKDAPAGTPEWVRTEAVWSPDRQERIHYVVVDSVATLLWLANIGCLELHVGFSTVGKPNEPTSVAFDLDPTAPGFERVRTVAMCLHELLGRLDLPHAVKTSGATGLQLFIPLAPGHTYEQTRVFTRAVAEYALKRLPHLVTLERRVKDRGDKVYVDYLQHGATRTLIAPYSPRARREATVSAPLTFLELGRGSRPEDFTLHNMPRRVHERGDLLQCGPGADLRPIVSFLQRRPAPAW
ncbi:non-homologous end-joining DNA ligase [Alicyclobacillus macrosporangiidus]|uniref:Bifunctional non-homologous end joining protein LigD n=1 Tax=Alicyclobacillus macrosporangiidus TaxID=392015 RepID=A0A1I7KUG5_9BACL|nr:non-homologous end-joining DNA ligase [Alicyclobacillus macrosporangiidus]SFV01093.1 bifunctional non-homologous end joining protein LigD [Alicyclobacillus macrosporangiidus]